ncbi:CPBP family intramembrane metalloprotease [Knoellia sp. 3-2P3]|uniref:CPBP family intramembrane glutamic endopeptidase n=1 Tax=unclassified Knoellia TaxID=2618719 RepID=UPI0023D9EACE|nr:CPBP family intramembrane glutamic endopeptidase [Knoellia sp. 3-2P3]MDF2091098.1 CPBP family intramembrane metalloprotease [Knoellia sp. 3-2P3]
MAGALADPRRPSRNARRCLAQAVGFLVLFALARALGLLGPPVVSATVLTLGMILIAWRAGATLDDVGLDRNHVGAGLRYGAAAFLLVLVALVIAAAIPWTRPFLSDARAEIDGGQLAHELGVTIVLLTAIPEELAFRGVLLGSAQSLWGSRRATVVSSALFGLWHIEPTLETMSGNTAVGGASTSLGGQVLVVLGAIAVTFVSGLAFCWLRLRSRSLVAPLIAHVATNGLALVVAWVTLQQTLLDR